MKQRRAVWVSTSTTTHGGVASFVRTMQGTRLWSDWNIEHISTHRNGSAALRIAVWLQGSAAFAATLIRRRPEVVHLHTASYGSFVRKALLAGWARALGVPVVMHVHGAEFHRFHSRSPAPLRHLIRHTLSAAATVVALGDNWAQRLAEIAPEARIIVVPNAVRPRSPNSHDSHHGPVEVLFLGEIGERKGTFCLLDAWARLRGDGAVTGRAHLTIAGDGAVAAARRRVADLGLGDSVSVAGWVDPDEVPGLLRGSHVLVLPSRNEGQPMAVLEAMAHGVCIVAGAVGGIPDLVDETSGILVPPDDVAALADALRLVVCDHDLRARLGAGAWQRVATRFDVDVVSRRFDALYREVSSWKAPAPSA
ncbi:glycosyltransferase family 4 protein [Rhodococcus sp. (in: high G+C Gram-positive bacteria)]|uniref:glycosyltransferase family 4 protein n=1 Tax=Rhodococcus sp. TaxID=1831 RepID=UPI00388DEDD7